jgi:gluconolactonase
VLVSRIDGVPGGIGVDEKGNLYVAAKGIAVYSPEGRLIHVMEMKEMPSNCAFGETDYKSLLITARGLVYRVRLDVKGATP